MTPVSINIEHLPIKKRYTFFFGKIKHCTHENRELYVAIVKSVCSIKEWHYRVRARNLLKGYANYASQHPVLKKDREYDEKKEKQFLERVLTVMLHPHFQKEFDYIERTFSAGDKSKFNISSGSISRLRNAVDYDLITPALTPCKTKEELAEIVSKFEV
jgi:hypothetical protein